MKLLYTLSVLFLLLNNVYSQDVSTTKSISIKSSSKFMRINNASIDTVFKGESVSLSWVTDNIKNIVLEVSTNGKDYKTLDSSLVNTGVIKLTPQQSSSYRISFTENITKVIRVIVKEKPVIQTPEKEKATVPIPEIIYFKASKEQIQKGEKVRLSWLVKNVNRISLETGKTAENTIHYQDYLGEGFVDFSPEKSIYYVIRIDDITKSLKVEVIK
jgi:hypothetical protein